MSTDRQNDTLGGRLRTFRTEVLQASVREAAEQLGCDYAAWSKIENGAPNRSLNTATLEALATRYQLSLNWLIAGIGPMLIGGKAGSTPRPRRAKTTSQKLILLPNPLPKK